MTDESDHLAVVGTDTGVGKTVVTAGLVGRLREAGADAVGIKPCQTGHPPDDDAGYVADVSGDADAAVCLERLEPALAPAVAADREGVALSYESIREGCAAELDRANVGIVEGIGGLRVPLAEGREVIDLVADLGLPALVVARSGLGTINHTGLTVEALRSRDVPVQGIVLSEYEAASVAERTNPAVLERTTDCPVWTLAPLDVSDPAAVIRGVGAALPDDLVGG